MKDKATKWLELNAVKYGITVNKSYLQSLCETSRHHVLLTPPYHPELQPIEKLWRNVKMYVARKFEGTRSMPALWIHLREAFAKYGVAHHCANNVKEARGWEEKYTTPAAHALSVDIGFLNDEEASEGPDRDSDSDSDSESEDDIEF